MPPIGRLSNQRQEDNHYIGLPMAVVYNHNLKYCSFVRLGRRVLRRPNPDSDSYQ